MADRLAAAKQSIDTDALSPRDVNAQLPNRAPDAAKAKAAVANKPALKEKEHPPPPPALVNEPPSGDRKDGVTYQVGRMLGKGGFAICHEGTLPGKKRFALKIVKSKMPSKIGQKFQTELQIHSKMRHVNIVSFLRAFSFDECTYLVLELCPNGSLMDMVKRRKGLTEPESRFYAVQIAGAIKYMHAKGIIHRDLKMGNIFLDKQMNAKIGDFGLAALLVTGKDMQTIRRTTLCGTPNYIAPEILEKGKKGHDHMVDIWSLGIIMFAMLTSKPPFQSSTQDEIYRRARNRDYEWPTPETSNKYISQEAKDLVAVMLQDADRRPEPDAIVQHEFFFSGYIPTTADMTPKLRDLAPDGDMFYAVDPTPEMVAQSEQNLRSLCRECHVGPWNSTRPSHKKTWREVALEEKAGLTPVIPLAEGIVYRPFAEVSKEQRLLDGPIVPAVRPNLQVEDQTSTSQAAPTGLLRAPPQSFAAQQRAQNKPSRSTNAIPRSRTVDDIGPPSASGTMRSRARREIPQSSTVNDLAALAARPAIRPRKPSDQTMPARPNTSRPVVQRGESDQKDVVIGQASANRTRSVSSTEGPMGTLFSPHESKHSVPNTRPELVLQRLQDLQAELERALSSSSMAVLPRTATPPPPHIVVKWVDYSNKFGLGYILNDGSIGCVLRSLPGKTKDNKVVTLPASCILVQQAEHHCSRKHHAGYADRQQLTPMDKPIQFYENNGELGLSTVFVDPEKFRIQVYPDGTAGKVPTGRDIYDYRKREHLILWKKFANYMMAYGRDQDGTTDDTDHLQIPTIPKQTMPPNDVVTFYQRIGDVGCWVFADGHLQFNFPDHTKIVFDAPGTWCHFWHLLLEAAEKLGKDGELDETALDERSVLSYPLQTLLNFAVPTQSVATRPTRTTTRKKHDINPMLQGIPAANDFRRKVEFIHRIIKEWTTNGGIGNSKMDREHRLMWTGYRNTANSERSKHVWVTIGAQWGDERYSAYVDPRKPGELGMEVEGKKA